MRLATKLLVLSTPSCQAKHTAFQNEVLRKSMVRGQTRVSSRAPGAALVAKPVRNKDLFCTRKGAIESRINVHSFVYLINMKRPSTDIATFVMGQ